ncbi:hypothetical protein [Virgibacillus doumboii]|uniref:hypothetical protein n=1 Tax=Virgibacillus doumboii TaxID=2697503 RepID=UPI0013DEBE4D|nr:hypothetical protein [Virgibacillus doumboii]
MWNILQDRLPEMWVFFGAFLVFVIPYTVFKVNEKLHDYGDPPWKNSESVYENTGKSKPDKKS